MKTNRFLKFLSGKANCLGVIMLLTSFALYSFTIYQGKPWPVPDASAKKANPVKADAESLKDGKEL